MLSEQDFNNFYKEKNDQSVSPSLLGFFNEILKTRLSARDKILDLGCGNYSIFEAIDQSDFNITAIDFSSVAIGNAPKSKIKYQQVSLLDESYFHQPKFNLVFDSHCLNCIEVDKVDIAFANIFNSLFANGIFASEIMVQPSGAKIISNEKTILECRDVETKLINTGFKIVYFIISTKTIFSVNNQTVDLLRFVAIK